MQCGVDIVKIDRFEKSAKDENFLKKYFSNEEQKYIEQKQNPKQTIAGIFCAKEAVLKAFGIGIGAGLNLSEISILHDSLGMPYVDVTAKIFYYLNQKNCNEISVSISHDGDYAVAFCVIN